MQSTPSTGEKHPLQSKSIWGIIGMALGFLCMLLGWPEGSFNFINDGLQVADFGAILTLVSFLLERYGQRTATTKLKTFSGQPRVR